MVTTMLSRMSTTKATPAATNAAPWPPTGIAPVLQDPKASSLRKPTATAEAVPATRPTQPAVGDIRFQNIRG